MTGPPTIRAELAAAVRAINAAYNRLPADAQERVEIHCAGVEGEVDAAIVAGDRPRAERAIRAWRDHLLHEIGRAK